jgi:hypothetical protein
MKNLRFHFQTSFTESPLPKVSNATPNTEQNDLLGIKNS